jgi:hypothetical protein
VDSVAYPPLNASIYTLLTTPLLPPVDAPSKEDLVTALEIVTDYLTLATTEKLLAAFNMNTADLNGSKSSAAANLKRKADWEQELEVNRLLRWYRGVLFEPFKCGAPHLDIGSSGSYQPIILCANFTSSLLAHLSWSRRRWLSLRPPRRSPPLMSLQAQAPVRWVWRQRRCRLIAVRGTRQRRVRQSRYAA